MYCFFFSVLYMIIYFVCWLIFYPWTYKGGGGRWMPPPPLEFSPRG